MAMWTGCNSYSMVIYYRRATKGTWSRSGPIPAGCCRQEGWELRRTCWIMGIFVVDGGWCSLKDVLDVRNGCFTFRQVLYYTRSHWWSVCRLCLGTLQGVCGFRNWRWEMVGVGWWWCCQINYQNQDRITPETWIRFLHNHSHAICRQSSPVCKGSSELDI